MIISFCIVVTFILILQQYQLYKQGNKLSKLLNINVDHSATSSIARNNDERINTIIDILMRNARTEAVDKGLIKINSPIQITEKARYYFTRQTLEYPEGIIGAIKSYYNKLGIIPTERELFLGIQRIFGNVLEKEVCLPERLIHNTCLLLAAELFKESYGKI